MVDQRVFEQSIEISASATTVEQCFTDLELMHRWLNPALRCEPVRDWSTELGSRSRFIVQVPVFPLALNNTVVEREPGLIVWQFNGFFVGRDRWQCDPTETGTRLLNRFEFTIPNPIVQWGFDSIAADWTKQDMARQLQRLRRVAEALQQGIRR